MRVEGSIAAKRVPLAVGERGLNGADGHGRAVICESAPIEICRRPVVPIRAVITFRVPAIDFRGSTHGLAEAG